MVHSWQQAATLPTGRLNHCLVAAGSDSLYVVGGYNYPPPIYFNTALHFNATENAWASGPNMTTTRDSFGCGVVGSMLMAVGGESGDYPFTTNSVERLDLNEPGGQWARMASLQQARQGHSVATLGSTIFTAGGLDPSGNILASVEAFDSAPASAEPAWQVLAPMQAPRLYFGLAAGNHSLYAIGGMQPGLDQDPLASVEGLDLSTGRWRPLAPLPEPRERMSVAVAADGTVYVMGGCPKRATPDADPCDALLSSVLAFTPPAGGVSGAGLGSWAAVAQLPQANAWSAAAALGGYIYNTGGGLTYGRNTSYRLDVMAKGERQ